MKLASTTLRRYQEALSKLPLDKQLERQQKITSPKTLKRFLSEGAPIELAMRFGHRMREAAGLTTSEKGRAAAARGNLDKAKDIHRLAVQEGDKKGHLGLAEIALAENKEYDALQHAQKAIKHGIENQRLYEILGQIHFVQEHDNEALGAFGKQVELSDQPEMDKPYLEAIFRLESPEMNDAITELEELGNKGHGKSLATLVKMYTHMGDEQKKEEWMRKWMKSGNMYMAYELGRQKAREGKSQEAKELLELALEAGHHQSCVPLVALLLDQDKPEEARKVAGKAIEEGEPSGHIALANILCHEGKESEGLRESMKAINAGYKLPFPIRIMALLNTGQLKRAEKECQIEAAKTPAAHIILSMIYDRMGEEKKCKKAFNRALRESGMEPLIQEARTLHMNGMDIAAIEIISEAIGNLVREIGLETPRDMLTVLVQKIARSRLS